MMISRLEDLTGMTTLKLAWNKSQVTVSSMASWYIETVLTLDTFETGDQADVLT